jgi:hypothetical protein
MQKNKTVSADAAIKLQSAQILLPAAELHLR